MLFVGKVEDYKKWHKPQKEENSKYHQGYFYPKHPEKCVTRENIYRSSWEALVYRWCDDNPNILRWGSEPISVKYLNPIANLEYCNKHGLNPNNPANFAIKNYFLDLWFEIKDENGLTEKYFAEIKPYYQTIPPKPLNESKAKLKDHKQFVKDAKTYAVNMAKWNAAKKFCAERGCKFIIITEHTLKKLGLL